MPNNFFEFGPALQFLNVYLGNMRFLGKFILIVLFVPLFLLAILTITVKFQLLRPDFWQTTFRANDVYTKLSVAFKNIAETQTVKEGGSLSDARVLTNLITPANLQDFLEKNFKSILDFVNGKVKEAAIYIPIRILPSGFIPKNFGKISENTPLTVLLSEFNVQGIQKAQIDALSHVGLWSTYLLTLDVAIVALISLGLFLLVEKGKRFVAPGLAFILAGFITLAVTLLGFVIRGSMLSDWVKSKEPVQIILSPFAPYVLGEILKVWLYIGSFAILIGIVLLFLRRK